MKESVLRFLRKIYHFIFCPFVGFILWPFCAALNIKFLNVYTMRIGHLCVEPDCYVKEEILGEHPKYKALILAPRGKVANEHILSYWEHYLGIIRFNLLCTLLKPLSNNRFTTYDVHRYASPVNSAADFSRIQSMYHEKGGRPLLALTDHDLQLGRDLLFKQGVPHDAWFVCVHCREDGYVPGEEQTYRNADITSYLPAMEAIIERGGWVIRLGDPSMKKIPSNKYIIDFAHLDNKSDWMDVYLCAACRFFLGSASGLSAISAIFGIPSAIANQAPVSVVLPYLPEDIGIHKLLFSLAENRYLRFAEIMGTPIGNFRFDSLYMEANIRIIDNTAEDIKALALEMLGRIDGKTVYSTEDDLLQERFKSLMNASHYSYRSSARIGREFLRKYSFLLDD
ncbi:MAG: TIGR04372 family glycosyltransferase [Deltaproteobacteria bacterium]|nr:TIGR04372 family glycosyltransferase [Deltaproteobacteria bacterium]